MAINRAFAGRIHRSNKTGKGIQSYFYLKILMWGTGEGGKSHFRNNVETNQICFKSFALFCFLA